MESESNRLMQRATDAIAVWKVAHDQVTQLEDVYKIALRHHGEGDAPFPTELQLEIASLRTQSERLLASAQHALLKLKIPKSPLGSSDSTLP